MKLISFIHGWLSLVLLSLMRWAAFPFDGQKKEKTFQCSNLLVRSFSIHYFLDFYINLPTGFTATFD